jgi:type VI secretion system secreted protein VgrG
MQYNGQDKSGYADGENNIKAIHTRSGHIIKFTEDESIIITDKIGNEIELDTVGGNITITAPQAITMNATNIIMNALQNITATAGMNITESAGADILQNAIAMISQNAGADYLLMAKNITKVASENYSADAKDISRNASGKIEATSVEEHTQNSKGKVENLSGEKSLNA